MTASDSAASASAPSSKTVHSCIVYHAPDGVRAHGRPLALLASDGQEAWCFALIGDQVREVPHLGVVFAELEDQEDAWVYDEWTEWFMAFMAHEIRNPDSFRKALHPLETEGTYLYTILGTGVIALDGASSRSVARDLARDAFAKRQ